MLEKGLIIAALIELVTVLNRACFGSMQAFFKKNKRYFKVRIHHGYVGIAFLIAYHYFLQEEILYIAGVALFVSDAIHHFIVLPIWVGRTEFP